MFEQRASTAHVARTLSSFANTLVLAILDKFGMPCANAGLMVRADVR